jgi:hypothetical protein
MNKQELINTIERKRGGSDDNIWIIGITNDPERRKSEHQADGKHVNFWKHWRADSESIARDVEKHFLDKGMKGGGGGGDNPRYIYIF